jgi:hypothetical protein
MRALFSVFVLVLLTGNSDAALVMSFTSDGSPQPLTTINVGDTATLDLYLRQTANEFDTGGPYAVGLGSAGTRLNFGPEVQVTAFLEDSAWDSMLTSLGPGLPPISGFADLATGVFSEPAVFPVSDAIKIGTVTFLGVASGLASVSFQDTPSFDDFVLMTGPPSIDGSIDFSSNSAQIQVNGEAIPEPGTVGLSLLVFGAASVVSAYRARRRRNQLVNEVGGPPASSSL